jgi:transposase
MPCPPARSVKPTCHRSARTRAFAGSRHADAACLVDPEHVHRRCGGVGQWRGDVAHRVHDRRPRQLQLPRTGHDRRAGPVGHQPPGLRAQPGYKAEAVRLVLDSGRSVADVAKSLGIHEATLGNWVKKAKDDGEVEERPLSVSERAELEELRKKYAQAQMDIAFLKKSGCATNAEGCLLTE